VSPFLYTAFQAPWGPLGGSQERASVAQRVLGVRQNGFSGPHQIYSGDLTEKWLRNAASVKSVEAFLELYTAMERPGSRAAPATVEHGVGPATAGGADASPRLDREPAGVKAAPSVPSAGCSSSRSLALRAARRRWRSSSNTR